MTKPRDSTGVDQPSAPDAVLGVRPVAGQGAGDRRERLDRTETERLRGNEPILLVEDNDLLRGLTSRLLTRFGYQVQSAATIEEAQPHLAGARLLLSDVIIGNEMAGPRLARQAKEACPSLMVLLTTGHAPQALEREGVTADEFPILYKPYSIQHLLYAVRSQLDAGSETSTCDARDRFRLGAADDED